MSKRDKTSFSSNLPGPDADSMLRAGGGLPLRVLLAAHSHPQISNGGAEIAAYQLFRGLAARDECQTWFLGCDRHAAEEKMGAVFSQPFGAAEYIYGTSAFDWFKFSNRDPRFRAAFEELLARLAPDIVHFHHYINFGVEAFAHVKRVLPAAKIVLTLHEYLAICQHYGQMITKAHHNLCYEATPSRCHDCFPAFSKPDFFLRRLYIERFFAEVDMFIAPSRFLAERYIEWGLPPEKLTVLENLMPPGAVQPALPPPAEGPLRVGFFGQISVLKGIDILFDAAAQLETQGVDEISFEIFGDYSGQPPEFQQGFLDRLAKAGANIRFNGPYDRRRVDQLMQSVHLIVVPSIWWENSPVVIQEALRNRRPVICSDIGGMAEKVRDGIDGFHFHMGNASALVLGRRRLAPDRAALASLTARMNGEAAMVASIDSYLAVYRELANQLVVA
jgi:glycosyltransferase involved in cell wall biosynthesis